MFDKELLFHIVKNGSVVMTNIPDSLLAEVNNAVAETKYLLCPILRKMKRQKKYPIDGGYLYLCSYDPTLTKNNFAFCFDVCLSLITSYDNAIKRATQPAYDIVKAIRHNVYDQLSHIQDDMKSLISFDDIPYLEWDDIVGYASGALVNNSERAGRSVLRTIQRSSTALAEFDAYDIINSTTQPSFASHQIHKVVKLSLQPYLYDFWNKNVKVIIGECYEKVRIDYELINLALNHFWNNAVKYTARNSEINLYFSPYNDSVKLVIKMLSLMISSKDMECIYEKGSSGIEARKAKLYGTGLGMYYIKECISRSQSNFSIEPGITPKSINGKLYAVNSFSFYFPRD